ncbi:hypothetical protein ACVRZD_01805 [Streptococcus hongkongensis]|nr:hypothetical protein NC01_01975 [Streptococcus uberis]
MKSLVNIIKSSLYDFIEGQPHHSSKNDKAISLTSNRNISLIKHAMANDLAIHAICPDKNVTGKIIKYQKEQGQLIMENSDGNLSLIVRISEIQKISLLPKANQ